MEDNIKKRKEYDREYYLRNADKKKKRERERYLNNKKKFLENRKEYYIQNTEKIKKKNTEYYENNKEKILVYKKEYRQQNVDKIREYRLTHKDYHSEYNQTYYLDNKKEILENKKKYYLDNKKTIIKKGCEYKYKRYHNDELYKLSKNIRNLIRNSIKVNKFSKKSKTHEILGCTFEEFKKHLEFKFKSWMNWGNYGNWNGQPKEMNIAWDIDHIIPLSTAITENDVLKLNHYSNLQPLCSFTNRYLKRNNIIQID